MAPNLYTVRTEFRHAKCASKIFYFLWPIFNSQEKQCVKFETFLIQGEDEFEKQEILFENLGFSLLNVSQVLLP